MPDAKKPAPTDQQRLEKAEREIADLWWQVSHMQKLGGFTDAKTLSVRSKRAEDRTEVLERDVAMLLDLAGLQASLADAMLGQHLQLDLRTSNAPAVIFFRKVRRRLGEWTEACKLKTRRNDVTEARLDENRIRPREAPAHS